MVDFLVSKGVKLRRVEHYPDYYDERPGGLPPGRAVVVYEACQSRLYSAATLA